MGKKIAVIQSNYIPWKGYFDILGRVDEFVLFDDVQYTRRDWRNRNQIKTPRGPRWLTIPVNSSGRYLAPIKEITVSDPTWAAKHWEALAANYEGARHFEDYRGSVEDLYLGATETRLSAINRRMIEGICRLLGIQTRLSWSTDFDLEEGRTQRIVGICKQAGATEYLSGPSARAYLDESLFEAQGITVTYMDYSGYREYTQLFPPFVHEVTVLDLIFNEGPRSREYALGR
jgi:hypothetical protein